LARSRQLDHCWKCPFITAKQTTFARREFFGVWTQSGPLGTVKDNIDHQRTLGDRNVLPGASMTRRGRPGVGVGIDCRTGVD
jgi:hypothetical protein